MAYERAATVGCYQLICSVQSGTDGGVLATGRAGSWVSCGGRQQESLACWMLESCSERRYLRTGEGRFRKILKSMNDPENHTFY